MSRGPAGAPFLFSADFSTPIYQLFDRSVGARLDVAVTVVFPEIILPSHSYSNNLLGALYFNSNETHTPTGRSCDGDPATQ
jgi:hypothetical protein